MSKQQQNNRLCKIIFFSNELEVLSSLCNCCGCNLEDTVLWETVCGHTCLVVGSVVFRIEVKAVLAAFEGVSLLSAHQQLCP